MGNCCHGGEELHDLRHQHEAYPSKKRKAGTAVDRHKNNKSPLKKGGSASQKYRIKEDVGVEYYDPDLDNLIEYELAAKAEHHSHHLKAKSNLYKSGAVSGGNGALRHQFMLQQSNFLGSNVTGSGGQNNAVSRSQNGLGSASVLNAIQNIKSKLD
jgi:hypothetical protein